MSIIGHGVDIVEVAHFSGLCETTGGQRALDRYFTPAELVLAGSGPNRAQRLAGRFAAKEAILKALGTGFTHGISFTDIDIGALPSGAPTVTLHARAAEVAAGQGITSWLVSISHTAVFAVGSAIALSNIGATRDEVIRSN
jgi:holo-[acyl-carrier protein] synthase